MREARLNYFAQPDKLICALIWLHVTPTVKIVHRRGADRAQKYLARIEHRELKDHPIDVADLYGSLVTTVSPLDEAGLFSRSSEVAVARANGTLRPMAKFFFVATTQMLDAGRVQLRHGRAATPPRRCGTIVQDAEIERT